ncbi:AraC family transcriptional regulator [Parasegetibacter sp. NRK P23]|uniref:helix-turn-helix domain-containing protein n=1 Tax=Parasegetibacter sp. NRK P23 TaxID=2942999 RepID=UPI002043D770|nr:helix-turn-helix domain-containing protein [Parasegetibacter sp. NRK P23]MCM5529124.1 AraC family transcriptional regulator [Parasegetibacter sp. NRK P23]
MILSRKHFDLNGYCVIEKLCIRPPYKHSAVFRDEACFLHLRNGEGVLKSSSGQLPIQVSESVVLKCGNYFADFIQKSGATYCEVIVVHLYSDVLKTLYKNEVPGFIQAEGKKLYAEKIERYEIIQHFIQSLDFYFRQPNLMNDELLILKIKELILLLLQTSNSKNIIELFSHLFTPRQANFNEIVQAHLFSNITIEELAMLSGRSLSAFKRDFESYFKTSPAKYIKEQKLLRARDLLVSTDSSILEICHEAGFNDASHFAKLFRQKYGSAPSDYKEQFARTNN